EYGKKIYENCRNRLIDKDIYYIDGGVDGEKRKYIKNEMSSTIRPQILVASYGTLSTGVSIKSISNIVLCDSFKSEQIVIQSIGRSLRLHKQKDVALIFDLVDVFDNNYQTSANYLYKHYKERTRFYNRRSYPNEQKIIRL
ncbi:MAG: helicase-related protein, partial [Candidatus Heimdallarchaeota archaeon]